MPIIPKVGRKAFRIRFLFFIVYAVLSIGALAMVYPFLLMLSTSITSSTDMNEFRVVPRYLYQEAPLFAKYVDEKYMGDIELVNALYHKDFKKGEQIVPPSAYTEQEKELAVAWRELAPTLPLNFKTAGFRGYGTHPSPLGRMYRAYVRDRFHNDIEALNRSYTEENENFQAVLPPQERATKRNWNPDSSPKMQDFLAWKATLPEEMKPVVSVENLFDRYLKEDIPAYGGSITKAAAVWGPHRSFDEIALSPTHPVNPAQRADWEGFIRKKLPFRYIAALPEAVQPFRTFLLGRYKTIDKLNKAYQTGYPDFNAVPLPATIADAGPLNIDWGEFIAKVIPLDMLRLDTPEQRFREFLVKKGINPPAGSTVMPPYYAADVLYVNGNAGELRRSFVTRNYSHVLEYILLHGRALGVTALFCLAVIATTLIVNPLCAYALSRYRLPYAYKILLFLLATMAFPAEVAMIPNFLLLKELGMLNTYWALILPGMASGFSIFLLKGFFDSLPKELYEAGTIDGASDTLMFFKLAIPLSKPIFAVIALQAFTGAYGAFMFALLVCQNPRMWTIMVWLYELQINNPVYIMMAALAVAAVPTLLVFVFAQNVIMRGIILPTEK
jgi:ABC-type glycerol-3-phosphate transport system permease component